jgi:hypothetical protein
MWVCVCIACVSDTFCVDGWCSVCGRYVCAEVLGVCVWLCECVCSVFVCLQEDLHLGCGAAGREECR